MSLTVDVYTSKGTKSGTTKLPKEVFDKPTSDVLLSQAVKVHLSNQRQNTKRTQTRGQVSYSTRKIWRQKGTGRARHGSRRAPIFVGGGSAHGPTGNENYSKKLPKKMRRQALLGALTLKQQDKQITVIKDITALEPKTKSMQAMLQKVFKYPTDTKKALIILDKPHQNVIQSSRNLDGITTTQANRLNVFEVLNHPTIIISQDALKLIANPLPAKTGSPITKPPTPAKKTATPKPTKTTKTKKV